ncbi:MAG TPA: SDR family oxidoreductase [Holophaga sp.]|nr:SDR family oxidoreductase [Holophaga sp.]
MSGNRTWWLLVGGRRRLGRKLAEALAPHHDLVLTSSAPWEGEEAWIAGLSKQTQVRRLLWDGASPGLVPSMMADLAALGADGVRLNSCVLVSGVFPEMPLGGWSPQDLAALWQVNLTFPLLAAQAVAPHLEPGGCLQFILDSAIHRPFLKRLPYTASKAGLAALVPGLAKALAPRVRVVGHALGTALPGPQDDVAALAARSLTGRVGTPEDLARSLAFAAASPYLTGEIITLDGGARWT